MYKCDSLGRVKSRRNQAKHKVSFETATLVFKRSNAISIQDRVVGGEKRWQTLGLVNGILVLLVAHTFHEADGEENHTDHIGAQKPRHANEQSMRITKKMHNEIAVPRGMKDHEIDKSDIPERKPGGWNGAICGKFYRPPKRAVTIRLDADILAWLKGQGKGYQTRLNAILRGQHGSPKPKKPKGPTEIGAFWSNKRHTIVG